MSNDSRAHFQVCWADLDANGHMANRAYVDYATQTRFVVIAARGFTPRDFREHGVGPVILEDRLRYFKELMFLDEFEADFMLGEQSDDGSRFTIRNRFFRGETLCCEIVTKGAWFDLQARKIQPPPEKLEEAMLSLPRFEEER